MGLLFIFIGVGLLGPIKLAFITSSRKVFSVVASIVFFNKRIDMYKMAGIVLVLLGMIAENFVKDSKSSKPHHVEDDHPKTAETGAQPTTTKKHAKIHKEEEPKHRK